MNLQLISTKIFEKKRLRLVTSLILFYLFYDTRPLNVTFVDILNPVLPRDIYLYEMVHANFPHPLLSFWRKIIPRTVKYIYCFLSNDRRFIIISRLGGLFIFVIRDFNTRRVQTTSHSKSDVGNAHGV